MILKISSNQNYSAIVQQDPPCGFVTEKPRDLHLSLCNGLLGTPELDLGEGWSS